MYLQVSKERPTPQLTVTRIPCPFATRRAWPQSRHRCRAPPPRARAQGVSTADLHPAPAGGWSWSWSKVLEAEQGMMTFWR